MSIAKNLFLIATKPEKGGFYNGRANLRYAFTGAILMDFLNNKEISIEKKYMIPHCKKNGTPYHDVIVEIILKAKRKRRISYWVRRLAIKYPFYISEIGSSLEKAGILRIEEKRFLWLFPWKKYHLRDRRERDSVIEKIRGILLYKRESDTATVMLIALLPVAGLMRVVSNNREERKKMRARMKVLCDDNEILKAVKQAITEIQVAIATTAAGAGASAH